VINRGMVINDKRAMRSEVMTGTYVAEDGRCPFCKAHIFVDEPESKLIKNRLIKASKKGDFMEIKCSDCRKIIKMNKHLFMQFLQIK
jgi:hypothetical protein